MAAAESPFRRPPQRGPKKHLVSLAFAAAIFAAVLTSTRRALFAQVKAPEVVPRPSAKKHHEAMTVVQLKEELRRRGGTVSGRKAELVARLEELASQDVSEEATAPKAAVPQPRRLAAQQAFAAGAAGNPEEDVKKWAEKRVQYSEMLEKRSGGAVELYKEADERLAAYFRDFPEMQAALRPQQVHSVKECLVRRGRCLNADEMGLGKTLSSLVVAQVYSEEWPMLVVAPTTVVQNWVKEVKKWLPHLAEEVQEINSQFLKPKRKDLLDAWVNKLIFVVSYDQLWRNPALGMQPDGSPYQAHF
ncbi:ZRANB3 [Symbiodinium natans]|uniref:ZRANB3 protein n=1 Tax=Symbiodinium natans TaxID=878477 RepID=A0A812PN02_9DINO|nr:ZRANB3 [Symbiodinium natans]